MWGAAAKEMNLPCRKSVQFETGQQQQLPSTIAEVCVDAADLGFDRLGEGFVRKEAELSPEERQYLMSVERGDIPTVMQLLQEAKIGGRISLNHDCMDPFGRTALMIAIENDNIEMIEVLLRAGVALGDALLYAISEDNVEATQLLLAHENTTPADSYEVIAGNSAANKEKVARITAKWRKLTMKRDLSMDSNDLKSLTQDSLKPASTSPFNAFQPVSSSFSPDITPVIMAAHRDNYEILKILLDRGDRIQKPHDVRCSCSDCVAKSSEDSLNHSRSRINAYRALASPSLIALSSKDPVLTAFELTWELRILSKLENELKRDYETLAKQCEDFAVELLDQVRGSKELEILLNYNANPSISNDGDEVKLNLDRLKLAIKYKQKTFVANSSCQQLLASLWYEGLLGFRRRHVVFKILLTVSVSLLFPVLSVVYMIAPNTRIGQFMRRPFIKFICHSASYMTFLCLLILASQRIESIISLGGGGEEEGGESREELIAKKLSREVRGAPPTSIEWMILVYVAGLVWAEIKQLWDQGLKSYIQDMWNILDFTTNSLYIATYTLKLVAYLKVEEEKRLQARTAMVPREQWDAFDPTLISEGLFAAANIFSSLKLIYIFTVNPHLGPLQISLGRMVIDIMKFLFIALLVCFSYSCGVNQLYWYYAEARNKVCATCQLQKQHGLNITCECDTTLSNLFEIVQTLYFAVYGLVDINHFELSENHEFTQFVGKLMYGTYLGIMSIVLINMLIAMLSSSFQKISNDADTEWKFARSRLWMSYFDEGGTVPPPFNIIPTPKSVCYLIGWLWQRLCRCSKKARTNKWQTVRKSLRLKRQRDAIYQAVIHELIKRYIMKRQRNTNSDGVNEDDLNEIKQDISSFRFELLEILRSNGMKIKSSSTSSNPPQTNSGRMRRKNSRMSFNKLCQEVGSGILTPQNSYSSPSDPFTAPIASHPSAGAGRPPTSRTSSCSSPASPISPSPAMTYPPATGNTHYATSGNPGLHSTSGHVPIGLQRSNETSVLHTLEECAEEEVVAAVMPVNLRCASLWHDKNRKKNELAKANKLAAMGRELPGGAECEVSTGSDASRHDGGGVESVVTPVSWPPVRHDGSGVDKLLSRQPRIHDDNDAERAEAALSWPPTKNISFKQLGLGKAVRVENEDFVVESDDV